MREVVRVDASRQVAPSGERAGRAEQARLVGGAIWRSGATWRPVLVLRRTTGVGGCTRISDIVLDVDSFHPYLLKAQLIIPYRPLLIHQTECIWGLPSITVLA